MININEINKLLKSISLLLEKTDEFYWKKIIDMLLIVDLNDLDDKKIRIKSLFGGMGSFNDLVLYKDGKMLVFENDELNILRKSLYELIHDLRGRPVY